MPSTIASSLISDFRDLVQDKQTPYRYEEADIIAFLNKALALLTFVRPDSYVVRENLQLVEGAVQTWPDSDAKIRNLLRNRGTTGTDNGRKIIAMDLNLLHAIDDNFLGATADAEVLHYAVDPMDHTVFYVYPPQPATPVYVEILRSSEVPTITANTDTVMVNDRFAVALPKAMAHFAYSQDDTEENNAALADKNYQLFLTQVGAAN